VRKRIAGPRRPRQAVKVEAAQAKKGSQGAVIRPGQAVASLLLALDRYKLYRVGAHRDARCRCTRRKGAGAGREDKSVSVPRRSRGACEAEL